MDALIVIFSVGIAIVGGYLAWPLMQKQLCLTRDMSDILLSAVRFLIRFIVPCVILIIAGAGLFG